MDAELKFRAFKKRVAVSRALSHLNEVSQALAFERTKREQTKVFADLKRIKKVFNELYRYKEEKIRFADLKVHATAFLSHNLLIKGLKSLMIVQDRQVCLR